MAGSLLGYDPPELQSPHQKLKSAGFTTGAAIAVMHVVALERQKAEAKAKEMLDQLRKELEQKQETRDKNTSTGRYIVTVALIFVAAVGFIMGKVFG